MADTTLWVSLACEKETVADTTSKVMIVWNQGKGSPIHDHANAHCIMRVLEGRLNETVYGMPEPEAAHNSPLSVKKNTTYQEKEVAYISDKIGLHRVSNPDSENVAISLHRELACVRAIVSKRRTD